MIKPFHQDFPLTQKFGENPQDYAKFGLSGHNGLDYGLPTGTDVIAPHAGTIIEVAFDEPGYGNYIKIENDKEGSVLAHLQESLVKVGDVVTQGQLIAHSDNTGNSTGAHLHWGYYVFPRDRSNGYAGFIDQLPLLTQTPAQPDNQQTIIDQLRNDRDKNWNLYQTTLQDVEKKEATIQALNDTITTKNQQIAKLQADSTNYEIQVTNLTTQLESSQLIAKQVPGYQKIAQQAEADRQKTLDANNILSAEIRALKANNPVGFWDRVLFLLNN